jgi:hypothetical protein
VVIGVIAGLIAILLPILNKARVSANRVKCSSNQRQLAYDVYLYANDFRGVLPFCNCQRIEVIRQQSKGYRFDGWLYSAAAGNSLPEHVEEGGLWRSLRTHDVYRCPADEEPFDGINLLSSYRMNHTVALVNFEYHIKLARFRPDAFLFWEVDRIALTSATPMQMGGDAHPSYGLTRRHGPLAPVTSFDGHVEMMTAAEFAQEAGREPGRLRCPPAMTWD